MTPGQIRRLAVPPAPGAGDEVVNFAGTETMRLHGRDGNDTLVVGGGIDWINGADGSDLLLMSGGRATGSLGDDDDLARLLPGSSIRLTLDGDAGRDGIDASALGGTAWSFAPTTGTSAVRTAEGWSLGGHGDGVLRLGNIAIVTLNDFEWIAV